MKNIGELAFLEQHSRVSWEVDKQLRKRGFEPSAKVIAWAAWEFLGERYSVVERSREDRGEIEQEAIEFLTNTFANIETGTLTSPREGNQ